MISINEKNYFLSPDGNVTKKYHPGDSFTIGDKVIPADKISLSFGGRIVADVNGKLETIDYPYYCKLIKAGYVVYKNYDKELIEDIDSGVEIRKLLKKETYNAIMKVLDKMDYDFIYEVEEQTFTAIYEDKYRYVFFVENVDKIVKRNIARRDNNLKFYPYAKGIDKWGVMYLAIFAEPLNEESEEDSSSLKYKFPNDLVKELIKTLGTDYHYLSLPIKSRILYSPDL